MPNIFIRRGEEFHEASEEPYKFEAVLQQLIAQYPNLLAGDQIGATAPRRWLLLGRESRVASWSVDHLFVDQDAVPTIVEVKRSSDTRIRREVVGQMLDYAANAVVYWSAEELRARFVARCESSGEDPDECIGDFLRGGSAEVFWESLAANLDAGRLRLVFVADAIPPELQRVVEFLNEQMRLTQVLIWSDPVKRHVRLTD